MSGQSTMSSEVSRTAITGEPAITRELKCFSLQAIDLLSPYNSVAEEASAALSSLCAVDRNYLTDGRDQARWR